MVIATAEVDVAKQLQAGHKSTGAHSSGIWKIGDFHQETVETCFLPRPESLSIHVSMGDDVDGCC